MAERRGRTRKPTEGGLVEARAARDRLVVLWQWEDEVRWRKLPRKKIKLIEQFTMLIG